MLLGLGLVLASRATSLLEFQLIYGVVVGVAAGAVFVPTMATVTGWFEKHRSLAVSLVSAGMGMAPMTISPFASWLITTYDWRTAQLVIAILAWVLLCRRPSWCAARRLTDEPRAHRRGAGVRGRADPGMTGGPGAALAAVHACCRSPTSACCATHSGPDLPHGELRHRLRPAGDGRGHDLQRRGAGGAGRPRRCSAWPATASAPSACWSIGLLVQALGAGAYFFVRQLGEFYAVAACSA